jgi:hypothetical protein
MYNLKLTRAITQQVIKLVVPQKVIIKKGKLIGLAKMALRKI